MKSYFRLFVYGAAIAVALMGILLVARRFASNKASSPEGILERADEMAWLNDWFGAEADYKKAERLFQARGNAPLALYAHVSQYVPQIQTTSMPALISEVDRCFSQPGAKNPEVRLRILTVKAMAELNYDAGMARKTWREVETLADQQHEYRLASRASGEQGILAFLLGDITDAKTKVTKAYVLSRVLDDPAAHVRYAAVFGNALVELHKYRESLRWLDESIDTAKATPGIAQPTIAFNAKVDALSALGHQREARRLAEEALVESRKRHLLGQEYAVLTNLAVVLQRQGDWNGAISDFSEGLGYARRLSYWRGIAESGGKLALAYEHQGDLNAALSSVDEALNANKHNPEELYFAPRNMAIKAEVEARLGRNKRAEELYEKSADVIDGMLMNAPTPDVERTLIAELGSVYAGYFKLASDAGEFEKAFQIIERARGRVEAQSLSKHSTITPHEPTVAEKRLNELQLELLDTDAPLERKRILDEIYDTEVQQGGTAALGSQSVVKPVSFGTMQRQLRKNELLIEYVLQDRGSYALAVTDTTVRRYSVPPKDVLEAQATAYRNVLHDKREDQSVAKKLFSELLAGIPEYNFKTAVVVIPDGKLHLLPFSSLVDNDGKYVIASHTISTAPSGTVLSLLRTRKSSERSQRPYLGVAAWARQDLRPGFLRALVGSPSRGELEALPESKAEVESIGAMLPKPATILLGSTATKERFEQLPLDEYEVLHLALHGYVDPEFPDRSALVFAPLNNKLSGDAGFLQIREILKLHLNARLVTLSACDTGVGPVGAEGIDNVVEAFIEAGAHTVVSTLWELQDQSTTHLMKVFYDHLAHGEAKADALRNAQLELLHDGAPPYYWASFQVVGDPSGNLYGRS